MDWLWKLIWRMKSDEQILIAKNDAEFWMKRKTYGSMYRKAKDRWDYFIEPEVKRRGLK